METLQTRCKLHLHQGFYHMCSHYHNMLSQTSCRPHLLKWHYYPWCHLDQVMRRALSSQVDYLSGGPRYHLGKTVPHCERHSRRNDRSLDTALICVR